MQVSHKCVGTMLVISAPSPATLVAAPACIDSPGQKYLQHVFIAHLENLLTLSFNPRFRCHVPLFIIMHSLGLLCIVFFVLTATALATARPTGLDIFKCIG